MSMQRYLNKRYRLTHTDNYDAYLKALNVKLFDRKMANVDRPVVRVTERDGKFKFERSSMFNESTIVFRLGILFEEVLPNGRTSKSVIDFQDNRMIHVQSTDSLQSVFVYEFTDRGIHATLKSNNIVCTFTYDRVFEK